jgi:hypothetical protein
LCDEIAAQKVVIRACAPKQIALKNASIPPDKPIIERKDAFHTTNIGPYGQNHISPKNRCTFSHETSCTRNPPRNSCTILRYSGAGAPASLRRHRSAAPMLRLYEPSYRLILFLRVSPYPHPLPFLPLARPGPAWTVHSSASCPALRRSISHLASRHPVRQSRARRTA